MQFLKADTQVIVTIGPFVDVGDGFTPQVDITLSGNEAEIKLQFDYDEAGEGTGKGGMATLYVNGEQVADKVFEDIEDSKFTGYVAEVTIAIPARK